MKLRDRLLHLLAGPESTPLSREDIAAKLKLARHEQRKLDWEIDRLLTQGALRLGKDQRYASPKVAAAAGANAPARSTRPGRPERTDRNAPAGRKAPAQQSRPESGKRPTARGGRGEPTLLTGKLMFRQSGNAVFTPDAIPDESAPAQIEIFSEDAGTAMHGDRVAIRVNHRTLPARRGESGPPKQTGSVMEVLERARDTVTGALRREGRQYYVVPDDPRFVHQIGVPPPADAKLSPAPQLDDKVVVRLDEWNDQRVAPTGTITEILGKTFEPRAELAAIYHKYKLEKKFPEDVEAEVATLPDSVRPQDREFRFDIRSIPTFTIDPDDAKDFDDALSLEALDGGELRIGVHIADVSAYVKSGTALDREALRRGNSTYLVGTVVPMLPFKLSNGLCSLKEGEDRLTKSVFFTFDRGGRLTKTDYANTVIHSRKRLTYRQAYALLKEDNLDAIRRLPLPPAHQTGSTGRALSSLRDDELRDLQSWVRTLWSIASKLRAERFRNGALDLDMPETKIFVDAEGYADRLEKIENDESHQLIEEFMLLANEAVARVTRNFRIPSLYRTHDDPDEEKLQEYREFAATMGVQTGDLTNRKELSRALLAIRAHPQSQILRTQLLRSLKRACYRAEPDGHFGLAKKDYTHFTSPIRRYSDLVVHRVYDYFLIKHQGATAPRGWKFEYRAEKMPGVAEHLSITEQNSTEAERESVKVKLLEYFERELTKKKRTAFAATIVEIRQNGMFVELVDSQAYGFIPLSTLKGDFFQTTAGNTALVGGKTKKKFPLGGRIEVTVENVDRFKRQLDFRVATDAAEPAATPPRRTSRQ